MPNAIHVFKILCSSLPDSLPVCIRSRTTLNPKSRYVLFLLNCSILCWRTITWRTRQWDSAYASSWTYYWIRWAIKLSWTMLFVTRLPCPWWIAWWTSLRKSGRRQCSLLHRLQDPADDQCPVIKMYIFHASKDPSAEVRRAALMSMGKKSANSADCIEENKGCWRRCS